MSGDAFGASRDEMVDRQIRRRGVTSEAVLEAMGNVPRHAFVPAELRHLAYADSALPIGSGQTISQPYMVAAMAEALELGSGSRVLEVGTGSGYQTAVIAEMAHVVFTIERLPELAESARSTLDALGYENIVYMIGDGCGGWPSEAPFDAVLVAAGTPTVPEELLSELREGGRLVIPVGGDEEQDLYQYRRVGDSLEKRFITRCRFVPLIPET